MFKFVEKGFFAIVHKLSLLFATIAFLASIVLGIVSYENINNPGVELPMIEFSKYQPSITTPNNTVERKIEQQYAFNKAINTQIQTIINNLGQLPDGVIDKNNLDKKIALLVHIKSNTHPRELQLLYAKSLANLTQQMLKENAGNIQIDNLLQWHQRVFIAKINTQLNANSLKYSTNKTHKIIGFPTLGMAFGMLGIFMILVMMLAVLRIEKTLAPNHKKNKDSNAKNKTPTIKPTKPPTLKPN